MSKARDANWIDGLRGIASFTVVTGHLCTAFAPYLHAPALPNESPMLFQLPFFRLCVGGRSAVALFFLITGYVNSVGPISKARAGNTDAAFQGIARSALARSGRLILPAMIATMFSWFLANVNAYHMTKHIDATWIRQGWHRQEATFWEAIKSLVRAEVATWTRGWDEYDGTQWTLILFLEGSMMVYMILTATVLVTPRARKSIIAVIYAYAWVAGSGRATGPIKSLNICIGMLVAELHNEFGSSATEFMPAPVSTMIILLGMFLCGYPQDGPDRMVWSNTMRKIMMAITPREVDIRRYWDSIGASILLLGCFFNKHARSVLSSPIFNFLGRVSFPVYLLHNQLIKSLLTWMIYLPSAMNPPHNEKGEQMDLQRGSPLHMCIAFIVFYYVLYRMALWWTIYIDPLCAKAVKYFTSWAYGESPAPPPNEKPILMA